MLGCPRDSWNYPGNITPSMTLARQQKAQDMLLKSTTAAKRRVNCAPVYARRIWRALVPLTFALGLRGFGKGAKVRGVQSGSFACAQTAARKGRNAEHMRRDQLAPREYSPKPRGGAAKNCAQTKEHPTGDGRCEETARERCGT